MRALLVASLVVFSACSTSPVKKKRAGTWPQIPDAMQFRLYVATGQKYLVRGEFDRAAMEFNSAIVLDPTHPAGPKGVKLAGAGQSGAKDLPMKDEEIRQLVKDLVAEANAAKAKGDWERVVLYASPVAYDGKGAVALSSKEARDLFLEGSRQLMDRAAALASSERREDAGDLCTHLSRVWMEYAPANDTYGSCIDDKNARLPASDDLKIP